MCTTLRNPSGGPGILIKCLYFSQVLVNFILASKASFLALFLNPMDTPKHKPLCSSEGQTQCDGCLSEKKKTFHLSVISFNEEK